jgi:hypothetical protein
MCVGHLIRTDRGSGSDSRIVIDYYMDWDWIAIDYYTDWDWIVIDYLPILTAPQAPGALWFGTSQISSIEVSRMYIKRSGIRSRALSFTKSSTVNLLEKWRSSSLLR